MRFIFNIDSSSLTLGYRTESEFLRARSSRPESSTSTKQKQANKLIKRKGGSSVCVDHDNILNHYLVLGSEGDRFGESDQRGVNRWIFLWLISQRC